MPKCIIKGRAFGKVTFFINSLGSPAYSLVNSFARAYDILTNRRIYYTISRDTTKMHTWCIKCAKNDKKKRANFNLPGGTALYCKSCIPVGVVMVNVNHKRCEKCDKYPSFGYSGGRTRVCVTHKEDDMVCLRYKRCEKCNKHPSYGYPGEPARFCTTHKEGDMVNIKSKRCEKCDKQSVYGHDGEPARFCIAHKESDMVCVTTKVCPGYNGKCPVRTHVGPYKQYCLSCDPDDGRRKRFKRLEGEFFEYITGKIDIHKREFRVNFDQNDTSKKFARVDGIVIGDDIVVCIEVDEDGHKDYECEEHRMHLVNGELLQLYPGHNIAWVRVNPTAKSTKTRNKRFDAVIKSVNCILETKKTEVVYIGFN